VTVQTDIYPTDLLTGCETALVLFAAAFGGRQDAAFIADAGLAATCVDQDGDRLLEMAINYPAGWEFVHRDVYEFVREETRRWDVVSADPWTTQFDRCADLLPTLCRLARRAVILGTGPGTILGAADGWRETSRVHRSDYRGGTYWATVELV